MTEIGRFHNALIALTGFLFLNLLQHFKYGFRGRAFDIDFDQNISIQHTKTHTGTGYVARVRNLITTPPKVEAPF